MKKLDNNTYRDGMKSYHRIDVYGNHVGSIGQRGEATEYFRLLRSSANCRLYRQRKSGSGLVFVGTFKDIFGYEAVTH